MRPVRKARVRYEGSTDTWIYLGLPPKRRPRLPSRPVKHPLHRTNRCCRLCHAVNVAVGENVVEDVFAISVIVNELSPQEKKSKYYREGIAPEPAPWVPGYRGRAISHKRTRPTKGTLMVQLIDNSTGGQDGEGL